MQQNVSLVSEVGWLCVALMSVALHYYYVNLKYFKHHLITILFTEAYSILP